ncbi:hypothetical protein [Spirosoma oryzicola]|nr:hypothetical protein [Spirosoma oryzicola]UHG91298.1 hypothetical protein LQ777_24090 [Spirosoma oryzicola]
MGIDLAEDGLGTAGVVGRWMRNPTLISKGSLSIKLFEPNDKQMVQ